MTNESSETSSHPVASGMVSMPRQKRKQRKPLATQSPDPPWQYGNANLSVKQEPMDDGRNDSGVTSGSDCPSASPGSDRSGNNPFNSPLSDNISGLTSNFSNDQAALKVWFNADYPQPTTSTAAKSPALPTELNSANGFDNSDISVPKVNSHGKIKVHKCKQCAFVAYTKLEFWRHSRVHIREDKALKCPECPFVTEFKHHLEYHIMNHRGAKPFKCHICKYSCVNKSMLKSHIKSHSNVYQYRCENCAYESKYMHSLKLHLRRNNHTPAMVLNPDGTPNPEPVIDVYGSRRGPRAKKKSSRSITLQSPPTLQQQHSPLPFNLSPTSSKSTSPQIQQSSKPFNALNPSTSPSPHIQPQLSSLPFNLLNPSKPTSPDIQQPPLLQFNPLLFNQINQNSMLPFSLPLMSGFPPVFPNPELLQNFQMIKERLEELSQQTEQNRNEGEVLDLSKPPNDPCETESEFDGMTTAFANVEVIDNDAENSTAQNDTPNNEPNCESPSNGKYHFHCDYCGIGFGEEIMYTIHKGYHGYCNPFTCNMCGIECGNSVNFFMHIAKASH